MKANPGVKVSYKSTGDNTPTVLATAVAGGNPPDLASVSQPGLVSDFQKKGALKNIDYAKGALAKNYPADIAKIGVIKGHAVRLPDQGRQQVDRLVQRRRVQERGRQGPDDVARSSSRPRTR